MDRGTFSWTRVLRGVSGWLGLGMDRGSCRVGLGVLVKGKGQTGGLEVGLGVFCGSDLDP
jgi:hypothetical protein